MRSNSIDKMVTNETEQKKQKQLIVGATSAPHAEILEQAKPILEEKGIELEIEDI